MIKKPAFMRLSFRYKGTIFTSSYTEMAEHNDFGFKGEDLAKDYLLKKGYKILKTNYRIGYAEVDIIAEHQKQIVFVEVKARRQSQYGNPEIAVNRDKRKNMKKVARAYIENNKILGEVRFDIVSILMKSANDVEITHFEDAFFLK